MGKKNDPLARAEEVGQQVFEAVASGLTEVVGKLQALAEQIEQKVEEQLRTSAGTPPPAGPSGKSGAAKTKKAVKSAPAAKASKAEKASKASKPAKAKSSAKKSSGKKTAAKKSTTKAGSAKKKSTGKKSTGKGSSGPTRDELYEQAQKLDIAGRSSMSKAQLAAAIAKATK